MRWEQLRRRRPDTTPDDGSLIYLAKHILGLHQKKEQASKAYVRISSKPIQSIAINGHRNNLRFWVCGLGADEIGCADSTGVTGYILDRDEARTTRSPLSTQMISLRSTIWRSPPTSHAVRLDDMFLVGSSHGANIAATRNPL